MMASIDHSDALYTANRASRKSYSAIGAIQYASKCCLGFTLCVRPTAQSMDPLPLIDRVVAARNALTNTIMSEGGHGDEDAGEDIGEEDDSITQVLNLFSDSLSG